MKFLVIILGIFLYLYCFKQFLKFFFTLLAINKVWIPMFFENKKYFANDDLLIKLKGQKLFYYMVLLIFLIFVTIFIPEQLLYMTICIIIAYIIAKLSFNPDIYEKSFFSNFSNYLKK